MITKQQFDEIGLSVDELIGNAALEWIAENTTIDTTDITKLSASAKLFIKKFAEINKGSSKVASQSIEGLSQSFVQTKNEDLIWDSAISLLGDKVKSRVKFVTATKKWR